MTSIPNVQRWHVLGGLPGLWDKAVHYAVTHDSQGNVYVSGCAVREQRNETCMFLQRLTSNGTLVSTEDGTLPWYSGISPYDVWTELAAQRMIVDEANNRLYVLIRGRTDQSPYGWSYFLYAHDLATGKKSWSAPGTVGSSYEEHGHLDIDGDGNIWVAITSDPSMNIIKLTKFYQDGTADMLPYGGELTTTNQRDLFAFGARKQDNSLYLAYREREYDEAGLPIADDLVVERLDHGLTHLGKNTFEFPDLSSPDNLHEPEFHDGIVDAQDRFVIGGYDSQDEYRPSLGMYRHYYPLVFGFGIDGTEFFRYVDTSSDSFVRELQLESGSLFDRSQYPVRAIVRPGEGADVLYAISQFDCTLCIRDNGTLADQESLELGPGARETIGSCDYQVFHMGLDFTYVPSGESHIYDRRIVGVGRSVLGSTDFQCQPIIDQRPSALSFYPGLGSTPLGDINRVHPTMEVERLPLGQMPVSFRPGPRMSPPMPVPLYSGLPKRPFPAPKTWRRDKRTSFSRLVEHRVWDDIRALERMVRARISSSDVPKAPDVKDSLAELLKQLPVTANFPEEMREQASSLPLEGKGNAKFQEVLLQALNAIVADRVLAAEPVPAHVRRLRSGQVYKYGELAWLEVDGSVEADGSTLQVVSGVEEIPKGTDILWPAVTFRFTRMKHISGRLHLVFRSFRFKGYSSRLRMLGVGDKRMVDITESVDTAGRVISGRVDGLKDVVLVHVSADLSPSRFS